MAVRPCSMHCTPIVPRSRRHSACRWTGPAWPNRSVPESVPPPREAGWCPSRSGLNSMIGWSTWRIGWTRLCAPGSTRYEAGLHAGCLQGNNRCHMSNTSALMDLLFGQTRQAVLAILLLQPEASFHLRELARLTSSHAGTLGRELEKLVGAGLLVRREQGNQVR